jgi:hypothetical protein
MTVSHNYTVISTSMSLLERPRASEKKVALRLLEGGRERDSESEGQRGGWGLCVAAGPGPGAGPGPMVWGSLPGGPAECAYSTGPVPLLTRIRARASREADGLGRLPNLTLLSFRDPNLNPGQGGLRHEY